MISDLAKTASIQSIHFKVIVWVLMALCCCSNLLRAQEHEAIIQTAKIPLWQQGVSTWDGNGYSLSPVDHQMSPVDHHIEGNVIPSDDIQPSAIANAGYVVPIDPNEPTPQSSFPKQTSIQKAVGNTKGFPTVAQVSNFDYPSNSQSDVQHSPMLAAPLTDSVSAGRETAPESKDQTQSTELPAPVLPPGSNHEALFDPTVTTEASPLEEEVTRWYQYPSSWMKGWDSHAEFGLDGSSGNADTLALQTGLELKRKTEFSTFAIDTDYRVASSRDVTTEDNGRFNADYDRMFGKTPWSAFGKFGIEWDKFKAFDLRLNMNGGVGYHWMRTDDTTLVTRFGAGASKEIGAPDDDWLPEAVFGAEGERQLTQRQKIKAKIDYFPAWEDFSNFRLVSDVAWEILLDGSENLSLKLAATDRYDSTPQGAEKNDVYYSLLLIYKF